MATDLNTFQTYFPEFSDNTKFPEIRVLFWISIALQQLSGTDWGLLYEQGVFLYVAHKLTLEYSNKLASASGGQLGDANGPINNRTIADVSYSVDTAQTSYANAGYWNETLYGRNFWELVRMVGSAPIQLGYEDQGTTQLGLIGI